ncbi:hypothetical protein L1887_56602 [Cichorium endivia]|nr:hypothetical protein L1887_56602 [Cichorium endivia]
MQAPTRRSLMHLGLSGLQAQAHGKRVHAPTATDRSLTARSSAPVSALPPARVQLSRNAPWVPRVQLQPGASAIRFSHTLRAQMGLSAVTPAHPTHTVIQVSHAANIGTPVESHVGTAHQRALSAMDGQ